MPISIYWHDATQTIVRQDLIGHCVLDEMLSGIDQTNEMIDSVTHPVDTIADLSAVETLAFNVWRVERYLRTRVHPRRRLFLMVSAPTYLKLVAGIIRLSSSEVVRDLTFVETVEEALVVIDSYDTS